MKSGLIRLFLVPLFLFVASCEEWEKDKDLSAMLGDNRNIDRDAKWNAYAEAPLRIWFKDNDEGTFVFDEHENDEERDFEFIEIRKDVYQVTVEGENKERTLIVRQIDEETCKVRFANRRTWIVYRKD